MCSAKKSDTTTLRIIGGTLRSQKIVVPVQPGLRPTHDRVRETLFNWLQTSITDCVCLDAFAGSGALGFEAISRDASQAVLVEQDGVQAAALIENAKRLKLTNQVSVLSAAWPHVQLPQTGFNLVFLDPPFNSGLIDVVWLQLIENQCLADNCMVYVEYAVGETIQVPAGFSCYRSKQTKQVVYELYQFGVV